MLINKRNLLKGVLVIGAAGSRTPARAAAIKQGGSITVAWKDDVVTLDPAIGDHNENWAMIKAMFSRLMDYAPGTPNLVKDLATDIQISSDGRIYTFNLRQGVRFTNGCERTATTTSNTLGPDRQSQDPKPRREFLQVDQGL